jgi:hypothetical protein
MPNKRKMAKWEDGEKSERADKLIGGLVNW